MARRFFGQFILSKYLFSIYTILSVFIGINKTKPALKRHVNKKQIYPLFAVQHVLERQLYPRASQHVHPEIRKRIPGEHIQS